jgi:hypothetical protein
MLICQKYVFFGYFNHQIHFLRKKFVEIFLLVLACSEKCELRMQVNFKTFLFYL